jgi:hypothetical protein
MLTINQVVINAVANNTTPAASAPILANQIFNITAIATFSDGAAAGSLVLQGSNDPAKGLDPSLFAPTTWVTIPGASATVASGATTVLVPTNPVCYNWIRVSWTRTGAAGTLTVAVATQGY